MSMFYVCVLWMCVLQSGGVGVADGDRHKLVDFQSEANLVAGSDRKVTWKQAIGATVKVQGVYRDAGKGYFDRVLIDNTSLGVVWGKDVPKPEHGTPIELEGVLTLKLFGGSPPTSQGVPGAAKIYCIAVTGWKEVRRVQSPHLQFVE